MIEVQDPDRVEMSQRERDVLKVMQVVLDGKRTQAEAARLLKRSVRQIRRIQRKLETDGEASRPTTNTNPPFVSKSSKPIGRGIRISAPRWRAKNSPRRSCTLASKRCGDGS